MVGAVVGIQLARRTLWRRIFRSKLLSDTKFSILASIVKDVDVITYATVILKSQFGMAVDGDIKFLVCLSHVDISIDKLERVGSLLPVGAVTAPFVSG